MRPETPATGLLAVAGLLASAGIASTGCNTPPDPHPCLVETPVEIRLSTRLLPAPQVRRIGYVEVALSPQSFAELKRAICERASFARACVGLDSIEENPPIDPRDAHVRDRVIDYIVAAALDLGQARVTEVGTGERSAVVVAETYEDACGLRQKLGRRYSLPGIAPFLEVRDR